MAAKQVFQSLQGFVTFIPGPGQSYISGPGTEVPCPCIFSIKFNEGGKGKKIRKKWLHHL